MIIVLVGWSSAVCLYLNAGSTAENPFEEHENSKRFLNSLERMGGKTALLANDASKWFSGLWQGEQLAGTIAVLTLIIAACYYFVATNMLYDAKE